LPDRSISIFEHFYKTAKKQSYNNPVPADGAPPPLNWDVRAAWRQRECGNEDRFAALVTSDLLKA
jgi:hypothetical protein